MKVALILNANLHCSPYANIYSKILNDLNIDYDYLAWDRTLIGETGGVFYKRKFLYGSKNKIKWVYNYYRYSLFLIKQIKANKYDKLVIFGPQVGLFLYYFLRRRYNKRFCFDYRDIFIDQLFPKLFNRLMQISSLNVISSPGFKLYLPKGIEYTQSHNFDIETLEDGLHNIKNNGFSSTNDITILTIGSIRDFNENYQIMRALHNKSNYFLKFIGRPDRDGAKLKHCSIIDKQMNVEFIGFYKDEDEPQIINDADFINIFRPDKIKCTSTFTNRFYYALIYKKPMLVTKRSLEGSYVEKYNLGISLDNCSRLDEKLQSYISDFNSAEFNDNCNKLLNLFLSDYMVFKQRFIDFITS
jgi:hypothetical protein